MLTVAFRADLTRVVTFMVTREGTSRPYREIGIPDGHHPLTRHNGNLEQLAKVTEIDEYHVQNYAAWPGRLASISEGGGRLLDNMMMGYGASPGGRKPPRARRSTHGSDWPRRRHDQAGARIVYRRETPFCNLHVSLMDRMGVEVESFGDSSGRLGGLETS